MASLVLEDIDDTLFRRLKSQAEKEGLSVSEEASKLLSDALGNQDNTLEIPDAESASKPKKSFLDHILAIPKAEPDEPPGLFERSREFPRPLDIE